MLMYMFLFFSVLLISKAYCIGGSKVQVVPLYKLELQGVKNLTRHYVLGSKPLKTDKRCSVEL